jgi:hypothetical protein
MKTVQFKDLNVGDIFKYNNLEYVKIKEERISCCKYLNASLNSDKKNKIQVRPLTNVEKV